YEQCSLHITLKIPSSVKEGSRPSRDLIRSNSSGVIPWPRSISGVIAGIAWVVIWGNSIVAFPGRAAKAEKLLSRNQVPAGSRARRRQPRAVLFTPCPPILCRMKSVIVGTAGHIDHGKTALVKALTGIDADRLEEEKRRGITIDLGFAHLEMPSS